jgi:hypothetical protein
VAYQQSSENEATLCAELETKVERFLEPVG